MELTAEQREIASGADAKAAAMRIVAEAGALLGAKRLIPITSAHIDGALYHGPSGVEFAEFLAERGGRVAVPATLNIGGLDLIRPQNVAHTLETRALALRLMKAYEAMGCAATWTCAPYQAGHRPAFGAQVAWGESNAVAFCNSVLGARTNRYGDFLDIACALTGLAPDYGLHQTEHRAARILLTTDAVSAALKRDDSFWPVLGALIGRRYGGAVVAVEGVASEATEDRLKALGAAAAAFGETALFHIIGATPEAETPDMAFQGRPPEETAALTPSDLRAALSWLSTTDQPVTAVGLGSPHLSYAECAEAARLLAGRRVRLPLYLNTGRHVLERLRQDGLETALAEQGATLIADTCIVAAPIIRDKTGVLMTNSGKFARYAPANIAHQSVFGGLSDCIETAVAGELRRDVSRWR